MEMQTKLKYIDNLIKTRALHAGSDPKAVNLQTELTNELDNMKVKN